MAGMSGRCGAFLLRGYMVKLDAVRASVVSTEATGVALQFVAGVSPIPRIASLLLCTQLESSRDSSSSLERLAARPGRIPRSMTYGSRVG